FFESSTRSGLPEEHYVAFRAFREDPQANPLKTPSVKIEIYSERLAKIADTWELKKDEIIQAKNRQLPAAMAKVSRHGVPVAGVA
ncbi:hypothetical protein O5585_28015, partial [Escherichia coli]|nr:hypothetical protein [Escherichia coli]